MANSNDPPADVTVIAHRGFAGVAPENTLAAAGRAGDLGADAIECDVVATADGTPVVFHDRRLDDRGPSRGITDGTGSVDERSTAAVTDATVLGTANRIPTLAAFVDAVPDGVALNVELKHPGAATTTLRAPDGESRRARWRPLVERTLDALDGEPTLFSSFSRSALEVVRSLSPNARVAPIAWDLDAAVGMAEAVDADAVHPSIEGLRSTQRDPPGEYAVNAWTARTWQDARDALGFGVDGLIADYPNLLPTATERDRSGANGGE
ncbi:glycerophosphodiester phosphodiesterase [Halorarum halobium]|uniref:glycerophosphodiester phosphodiesterase n=1 Tax=Halorarum halobium TaxID=3075121 RepID=UPI0028A91687|nr:glycerophosphodiester phosphodiesterase [Halobaculum sp. XH14]